MRPLIDRDVIRWGDIISRYSGGPIAWGICLVTGQWKINHDAMIIPDKYGNVCVGDALNGPGCQITPLAEWEARARMYDDRILIGRPAGATAEEGIAAANHWREHIAGRKYDRVAILQIFRKRVFGTWWKQAVGLPTHFYCTESVRDCWHLKTPRRPYGTTLNVTPGDTVDAYRFSSIVEADGAFFPHAERWKVQL